MANQAVTSPGRVRLGRSAYDFEDSQQTVDLAGSACLAPESPAEGSNAVEEPADGSACEHAVAMACQSAGQPTEEGKRRRSSRFEAA